MKKTRENVGLIQTLPGLVVVRGAMVKNSDSLKSNHKITVTSNPGKYDSGKTKLKKEDLKNREIYGRTLDRASAPVPGL